MAPERLRDGFLIKNAPCCERHNAPWEAADHRLANPDLIEPGLGARCRPVIVEDAERARLDGLFNARLSATCDWPIAALNGFY